jgi:hypothetical protein
MFFLKCFDIIRIVFGVTLFGYGVFTFAVTNPQATQAITIPYRAFVLFSNILLFFHNIKIYRNSQTINNQGKHKNKSTKVIIICTIVFCFFYSCRLIHSVYISDNVMLFPDKFQYILYWFFMCLIPGINFLFLDKHCPYKYMYVTWVMLGLIGIFSLFLDAGSSSQFSAFGRLATAAINPIALGHYATSLFLISFYIILNGNKYQLLPPIANNKSIFIGSFFLGAVVTLSASSRSPLLALFICSILMLTTYQLKNKISIKIILFLLFLLVSLVLIVSNIGEENQIFERIFASGDELDSADKNTRAYLYDLAIKWFLQYPIIGFGLELPNGEGYPHNLFIESFLALGVCGGIAFILITFHTIILSIRLLASKNSQWGWVGILFIQYMIAGCSSGSLYGSSSFWYLLFAVLGVYDYDDRIDPYHRQDRISSTTTDTFSDPNKIKD